MADWNLKSPLLEDMRIDECLSESGGSATYLITHEPTDRKYIFKYISIPESQTHVDGLRYSGAIQTAAEAQAYYERVAYDYKAELENLQKLSDFGSIACYRAFHLQPKEEEIGFDLHLLTTYRQTLAQYMEQTPMTHLAAANLAMDLCTSLSDLRKAGFIHCNIKPENIFLNNQGHFMLGDLGLYRIDDLKYAAVPERMLGSFAAPELYDVMQTPNTTVDIYAVGLILYNIFNGGHSLFEDEETSTRGASEKRLSGEPLPAPIFADYEMASILLKACSFAPEDRYQTPEELCEVLKDYAQRNEPQDEIIVPPIVVDEDTLLTEEAINEEVQPVQFTDAEELAEDFVQHFSPDTESLTQIIESIREEIDEEEAAEEDATAEDDAVAEEDGGETEDADIKVSEDASEEDTDEDASENEDAADDEDASEEEASEEDDAPAAPAKKKKKKAPFWIWILIVLVVLAAALSFGYYKLTPNVTAIKEAAVSAESIAVTVESESAPTAFTATATDTYGNAVAATLKDNMFVFEGLNPGTQYTIKLAAANGFAIRGTDTVLVSTYTATEVLFFGAKPISESQVELNFTIAGTDLETWNLQYGTNENDVIKTTFTGHSTVISNLKANSLYTFTLLGSGNTTLSGNLQLTYDTTVRVKVSEITTQSTAEGIKLSWTYTHTGDAPASWTVICHGPDGFIQEDTVTEPSLVYTTLEKEKVYTVEIFCDGMPIPAEKTIRAADATISELTLSETEDGVPVLSWTTEDEVTDGWMIVCTLENYPDASTTFTTQETTVTLDGLLPESNYNIEILSAEGLTVNGSSTTQLKTPKATRYTANGLDSTYVGLFVAPQAEKWTYRDLASPRSSFKANENIAFALEALSSVFSSDEAIAVKIIVKNETGIVNTAQEDRTWDELWDNKLYVGVPAETPQQSGKYTLEIFFNGKLAGSSTFTIN